MKIMERNAVLSDVFSNRAIVLAILITLCVLLIQFNSSSESQTISTILLPIIQRSYAIILLGVGVSFVIASGDIDLSCGGAVSMLGMCAMFGASYQVSPGLLWLLLVVLALCVGFLHGYLIVSLKMQPLVVTLGTSFIMFGTAQFLFVFLSDRYDRLREASILSGDTPPVPIVSTLPSTYYFSNHYMLLGIVASILILSALFRYFSVWSVYHRAIGMNRKAAELTCIPVGRVRVATFVISAICSLLAFFASTAFIDGGHDPRTGVQMELIAIACAVIGGTRITGGKFHPLQIALAAILFRATDSTARILDFVRPDLLLAAQGILLLAVAIADTLDTRKPEK